MQLIPIRRPERLEPPSPPSPNITLLFDLAEKLCQAQITGATALQRVIQQIRPQNQ